MLGMLPTLVGVPSTRASGRACPTALDFLVGCARCRRGRERACSDRRRRGAALPARGPRSDPTSRSARRRRPFAPPPSLCVRHPATTVRADREATKGTFGRSVPIQPAFGTVVTALHPSPASGRVRDISQCLSVWHAEANGARGERCREERPVLPGSLGDEFDGEIGNRISLVGVWGQSERLAVAIDWSLANVRKIVARPEVSGAAEKTIHDIGRSWPGRASSPR